MAENPVRLVGLRFAPLSSSEIIKRSVYEVREPVQLRHPSLGLPNFKNKCVTCGAETFSADNNQCPGHSGHSCIPVRVYYPSRIRALVKILNENGRLCFYCCKRTDLPASANGEATANVPDVVVPDSEDETVMVPDSEPEDEHIVVPDSDESDRENADKTGAADKAKNAEKATKNSGKNVGHSKQNVGTAERCECTSSDLPTRPRLEFRVRQNRRFGGSKASEILMTINHNQCTPDALRSLQSKMFPDDWRHFNERSWRSKLLQPEKAYEYLRAIDLKDPEDYFITTLCVSPNAVRVVNNFDGGLSFSDTRSSALRSLLKRRKKITVASDGRSLHELTENDVGELQALVSTCLDQNLLGRGYCPDPNKPISGLVTLRKTLAKKTSGASARGVIRGDPFIDIDEIGIPKEIALRMGVPEVVTNMNLTFLQKYVSNRGHGGIARVYCESGSAVDLWNDKQLQLGMTVSRCLMDGDEVFINRPPTFHKHALLSLKAKVYGEGVFSLNPLLCTPLFADFDGDAIHVFVPQSAEVRAELTELLSLPQQLVSSQGGNCIVGLIQDSLLSAHLLTRGDVFLSKVEMDQLVMWCQGTEVTIPVPAIVKSSKGPFWTGKQAFGTTLPRGFQFEDGKIIISDGEVMKIDGSRSAWLGRDKKCILNAISKSYGPTKALEHLNSLQKMANEWISEQGFSVGLADFYLAPDLAARRKLEREVDCALEEAKVSALVQAVLADADVQINSVADTRRTIWTGKKDSNAAHLEVEKKAALEEVTISGFEKVMKDMGSVVKRHVSKDNSLLKMMDADSKGSLSRLVKQGACVGLQLREGYFHFDHAKDEYPRAASHEMQGLLTSAELWKRKGLVSNSFLNGLDPHEFLNHATSSRASSTMLQQCSSLFRFLMCYLKDVQVMYDNTVRWTYGNQICQFAGPGDAEPGEPSGALAATALIEPVYDMVASSSARTSASEEHPLILLKNVLDPGVNTRFILRLSKHATRGLHGPEWVSLKVQDHLKPITLKMLTTKISIEHSGGNGIAPWIGCFEFQQEVLWRCDLDVDGIVSVFNSEIRGWHFHTRKRPSSVPVPDMCFYIKKCTMTDVELHDTMVGVAFPALLNTRVKGCKVLRSVTIKWNEAVNELVVEAEASFNAKLGRPARASACRQALQALKVDCLPIADLLNWEGTVPEGVEEICQAFGIEAAYDSILSKLRALAKTFGSRNISDKHLMLIADAACHSGKVLSFKSTDYSEFLKSISANAPLALALGKDPKSVFNEAALERSCDRLEGATERAFCGQRPSIGTGAMFSLMSNGEVVQSH